MIGFMIPEKVHFVNSKYMVIKIEIKLEVMQKYLLFSMYKESIDAIFLLLLPWTFQFLYLKM